MNLISKAYIPDKVGDSITLKLETRGYIISRFRRDNEFIFRYKTDTKGDYYSPYFLFQFENQSVKSLIPYPNYRSFLIAFIVVFAFHLYENLELILSLQVFLVLCIFTLVLQFYIGLLAYKTIKKHVFKA